MLNTGRANRGGAITKMWEVSSVLVNRHHANVPPGEPECEPDTCGLCQDGRCRGDSGPPWDCPVDEHAGGLLEWSTANVPRRVVTIDQVAHEWWLLGTTANTSLTPDGWAVNVPFCGGPDNLDINLAALRRAVESLPKTWSRKLAEGAARAGEALGRVGEAMAAVGVAASTLLVRLKGGPHSLTMGLGDGKAHRFQRGRAYRLPREQAEEALESGRFELVRPPEEAPAPETRQQRNEDTLRNFFFGRPK